MHWHSDDVLIGLLQFGEQRVGEREQFLLLRSAGLFRRIDGTDPFRIDCGMAVALRSRSMTLRPVRSLPLSDECRGQLAGD